MHIATSTLLHNNPNYGAYLQAYALQRAIHNFGYDSEVIRFQRLGSMPKVRILKKIFKKRSLNECLKAPYSIGRKILALILYRLHYGKYIYMYNDGFESFGDKFIKSSPILYNARNAEEIGKNYGKIIVGSDQVWWGSHIKDKSHTLDFTGSRPIKFSYAASFGDDELPTESIPYVKKLADFDKITVREASAVNIIRKYTDKSAELVLDPTFLLDKTQWESLAEQSGYPLPERYVFVYAINNKKREILNFAKRLAKKINGEVILVHRGSNVFDYVRYSTLQAEINPADWLKLLLHANYVVTDSFHGTAFSVNLEKQFYVYANSQVGRINAILDMAGLQSRRIDGGRVDKRRIDFTKARGKLNAERERCGGILKKMLEWETKHGVKV